MDKWRHHNAVMVFPSLVLASLAIDAPDESQEGTRWQAHRHQASWPGLLGTWVQLPCWWRLEWWRCRTWIASGWSGESPAADAGCARPPSCGNTGRWIPQGGSWCSSPWGARSSLPLLEAATGQRRNNIWFWRILIDFTITNVKVSDDSRLVGRRWKIVAND